VRVRERVCERACADMHTTTSSERRGQARVEGGKGSDMQFGCYCPLLSVLVAGAVMGPMGMDPTANGWATQVLSTSRY
jgi:hypothetical protein